MNDLHDAAPAAGQAPNPILQPLILDFLEWLVAGPRPYAEVIEVWRTSCPRLTVWEDAADSGLIARSGGLVGVTPAGRQRLRAAGRQ